MIDASKHINNTITLPVNCRYMFDSLNQNIYVRSYEKCASCQNRFVKNINLTRTCCNTCPCYIFKDVL